MDIHRIYINMPYIIQNIMFNLHCRNLYNKRYGNIFDKAVIILEEFEKLSITEMKAYQEDKLRALIKHSYATVPYYNRIMKEIKLLPDDIKYIDDLSKLPVLTRQDIARYGNEMISTKYHNKQLVHGHTSGTTGSPLSFYWDYDAWFMNNVFDWRQKRWADMSFGDPYGVLLGRTIVPVNKNKPPFWHYNKYENQMWFSSFHLSQDYIKVIYDEMIRYQPKYLEGYPSTMFILAKLFELSGLSIKLKGVLTSSETLFENQRQLIEKTFSCKLFDYYGQAERVIWGTECNHHCGKHLNMDYGITEIVDEMNKPLPDGTPGYLVGTSLLNYGMPFIRYKIGDVSCINQSLCTCGSPMPLMSNVCTKQEDLIVTPSGRYISASILTHPFKPLDNIIMSQIVQDRKDHIIVNIVKNRQFTSKDAELLLTALSERTDGEINFEIKLVDNIDREASGKYKWVKSLLGKDMNITTVEY